MNPPTPASPLWGDHHEHPGCFGCQSCFGCVIEDEACPGCASLKAARDMHQPDFLAAFNAVTPHLGAPTEVLRLTLPVSYATWQRDGVTWELDDAESLGVLLSVIRVGHPTFSASVDPPDLATSAAEAVAACRGALR